MLCYVMLTQGTRYPTDGLLRHTPGRRRSISRRRMLDWARDLQNAGNVVVAGQKLQHAVTEAQLQRLRERYGDPVPVSCSQWLLRTLGKCCRSQPAVKATGTPSRRVSLLSSGPQVRQGDNPLSTDQASVPQPPLAAPAVCCSTSYVRRAQDECDKAVRFMQRCYRGRLGRSRLSAHRVEVMMSSQVDIRRDDDEQARPRRPPPADRRPPRPPSRAAGVRAPLVR